MPRMRIRTTEIEVELEDSQVESLIARALGTAASGIAVLPPAEQLSALPREAPAQESEQLQAAVTKRGRRGAPKTKRGAVRSKAAEVGSDDRSSVIQKITTQDIPDHERYNKALRNHTAVGDRAYVVLHLAREGFKEDGLMASEVVTIMERSFSIPLKHAAVRMALMRGACRKAPLVAARKSQNANIYWLTQDGLHYCKALLEGAKAKK